MRRSTAAGTAGDRSRTVAELVERWLEWRQRVRPISPVTIANYRGAIDRHVLPALGAARVRQVEPPPSIPVRTAGRAGRQVPALLDAHPPRRCAGERYQPRPGAAEQVHEPDCVRGWPLSPATGQQVHKVLSGAFQQAVWGWCPREELAKLTVQLTP